MKSRVSTYIVLLLTAFVLTQVTASTYFSAKPMCGMETPIEESSDEDTDNEEEELDKIFQSIAIENTDLLYSVSHHSYFEANSSELVREIVPPPPKV